MGQEFTSGFTEWSSKTENSHHILSASAFLHFHQEGEEPRRKERAAPCEFKVRIKFYAGIVSFSWCILEGDWDLKGQGPSDVAGPLSARRIAWGSAPVLSVWASLLVLRSLGSPGRPDDSSGSRLIFTEARSRKEKEWRIEVKHFCMTRKQQHEHFVKGKWENICILENTLIFLTYRKP